MLRKALGTPRIQYFLDLLLGPEILRIGGCQHACLQHNPADKNLSTEATQTPSARNFVILVERSESSASMLRSFSNDLVSARTYYVVG